MPPLIARLESLLFVASKPLSYHELARALQVSVTDVTEAVQHVQERYNHDQCGIHIMNNGNEVQMATNPLYAQDIEQFVKYEVSGELTKAQLETLTIIAYRGPLTRAELEQIRGVNCAVILRILLMRDLIVEEDGEFEHERYHISIAALAHLGVDSVEQLPEYQEIRHHEHIDRVREEEI